MLTKKNAIISLIVLALGVFAVFINFYTNQIESNAFTIAVTESHRDLLSDVDTLSAELDRKINIKLFDNENDLMKEVYSGQVDAYCINLLSYIESFSKRPSSKAILGIPNDYYLVASIEVVKMPGYVELLESNKLSVSNSSSEKKISRPRIGVFDQLITEQMLNGFRYTTMTYYDSNERLRALNDSLIDYAIISKDLYDSNQHVIIKKMSDLGYFEDVFILSKNWLDTSIEEQLNIVEMLSKSMAYSVDLPNESQVIQAMTTLFNAERIQTRYYYEDLVYSELTGK